MRNSYSNCFKVLLLLLFLIQLTGCAGKSFNYQPVDEIPKEPGVFSDQDEGFVKSDKRCAGEEKVLYYKEFQEYRGWKKWQRTKTGSDEFKEFLEWQKSKRDSDEFKEFQEWSEWKSYQEWKKKSGSSTE